MTGTGSVDGCIFCDARGSVSPQSSRDDLVLFRGRVCYVILNLYPYNNGHLMVVPNRHVATLAATTADELAELMRLTRHAEMALSDAYNPQGINIGVNLGRPGGRRHRRSSARASRAAVDGRHQFHVGRRQRAGAARGAQRNGRSGCGQSSSGSPEKTDEKRNHEGGWGPTRRA